MTWRQLGDSAFANARSGGRGWAKNPKTEPPWLGFYKTVVWCNPGRWWLRVNEKVEAAGLGIRQREAGLCGLGQKPENRAFVARFRVCRVKQRRRVMLEGGGCRLMTRRRRGGCTFANAKPGVGVGPKSQKLSACGSVSGVPCEMAG